MSLWMWAKTKEVSAEERIDRIRKEPVPKLVET